MALTKEERRRHGLYPSKDVDVATALELLSWSWYRFARSTEKLPPAQLRALLEALEPSVASAFLRSAVDASSDARLSKSWALAVNALKVFESQYAWGSKPKREKLTAISKMPVLLSAAQAAAVHAGGGAIRDEILAVLVLDGSAESLDALMPHFERAMTDPQRLMRMLPLERYARKTPELGALFERVHHSAAALTETSPVLALARRLGIADEKGLRVVLHLASSGKHTAGVTLDTTAGPDGFRAWVSGGGEKQWTGFNQTTVQGDSIGLGRCEVDELPAWLAKAAKKLRTKWRFSDARAYHLRGVRLAALLTWLSKAE